MNQQQSNYRLPEQNTVMMVGRLTRDPELRRTGTGKAVCAFDIAIGRRYKDATTGEWKDADPTFIPIVVWAEQGERCAERLKKGFPVHIEGRLQSEKWTATDGTNRSRLVVVASRVQSLSIVKQDSPNTIGGKTTDYSDEDKWQSGSGNSNSKPNVNIGDDEEDIPF
jgi:single-strand DNA-binding protein